MRTTIALLFALTLVARAQTTNVTCTCVTNITPAAHYAILPTTNQAWLDKLTNFLSFNIIQPTNNVPRIGRTNINGRVYWTIAYDARPPQVWQLWTSLPADQNDYFSRPADLSADGKSYISYMPTSVVNAVFWTKRLR